MPITSRSCVNATGCRCSYQSTVGNVQECIGWTWCLGDRKPSNGKPAWPRGACTAARERVKARRSINKLRVPPGATSQELRLPAKQDGAVAGGVQSSFPGKFLNLREGKAMA